MEIETKCGFCGINPKWLQRFATTRAFLVIYGLLGTVQAMAFVYIGVSLTALERRFKIPSRTTGVILSGSELSQILSVVLIYYGASGHRPRWIACGVAVSALSCFVLALPHFMYGPGEEALALTREYLNSTILSIDGVKKKEQPICSEFNRTENCDDDDDGDLLDTGIAPKLLLFLSQFILGIGSTLYYGLGQPFMDDNTKKKNTPMLLGITFSLRTSGPILGYILSYYCLKLYVDPTLHPIIDDEDPRWVGAWWLGWIILGLMMGISSLFLGMFPTDLRKSKTKKNKVLPIENEVSLNPKHLDQELQKSQISKPTLKDFIVSVKRILTNKLYMYNVFSSVFYVLGFSASMYFIGKYMEVQYGTSSGGGSIIAGPLKLLGAVLGFLISGFVIGKYKPSPRSLLAWNAFVGIVFALTKIGFIYIKCDTGNIHGINQETMTLNLTNSCNAACHCEHVKFSPVCHEPTGITYFSACHAGCQKIINDTAFGDCNCVSNVNYRMKVTVLESTSPWIEDQSSKILQSKKTVVIVGPCKKDCFKPYIIYSVVSSIDWVLGCSGSIGNVLLNYRCVESRDKSLAQGVAMMIISITSLIPGPIIAGVLMDMTCLIWDVSCKSTGNCWVYHKDQFIYVVNIAGAAFMLIGVFFDGLVAYYSKGIDLYGEDEEEAEKQTNFELNTDVNIPNEILNSKS